MLVCGKHAHGSGGAHKLTPRQPAQRLLPNECALRCFLLREHRAGLIHPRWVRGALVLTLHRPLDPENKENGVVLLVAPGDCWHGGARRHRKVCSPCLLRGA